MSCQPEGTDTTYTSDSAVQEAYDTLHATFQTGITKSLQWRSWQLKQLWWLLEDHEAALLLALQHDLNRHEVESYSSDLVGVKQDILKHL